jgi:hypothetical protein
VRRWVLPSLLAIATSDGLVQYCLPPNSVVFTGCVGDDELSEQLKAANRCEGLKDVYLVKKGEQTGACAVVITGHHRYDLPLSHLHLLLT